MESLGRVGEGGEVWRGREGEEEEEGLGVRTARRIVISGVCWCTTTSLVVGDERERFDRGLEFFDRGVVRG